MYCSSLTRKVGKKRCASGVGVRIGSPGSRVGGRKVAGAGVAAILIDCPGCKFELAARHSSPCSAGMTQRTRVSAAIPSSNLKVLGCIFIWQTGSLLLEDYGWKKLGVLPPVWNLI